MPTNLEINDRRRNALSALTGEFIDPRREQAFRTDQWPDWHRRMRVVVLVSVVAYLITTLTDYLLIGHGLLFSMIVAARLLVASYGLGFITTAERRHSPVFSDLGLLVFLLLLITTFLGMASVRPEGLRFSAPAAVLILCVFYAVPMTRMWFTLTSAFYLSTGLVFAARFFELSPIREIGIVSVQMAAVNLIGYFIARRMHQDARTSWINQKMLERREQHQRLLAQLSAQFLGVRADRLDAAVRKSLQAIGEHTGSDRAYLMEFDSTRETANMSHEWCANGIPATRDRMQNLPVGSMPWASAKVQRGEVVQAERVGDLPPEAASERDFNLSRGVQSFICVPLTHEGQLHGMIGLDCIRTQRGWDAETLELLRFVGQAILNSLHRTRAEDALRASESQFQTLTSLSPVGIFHADADGYCLYYNEQWTRVTGLPVEAGLGNRWHQAVHPDDLEHLISIWADAVNQKKDVEAEFRFCRPDGSVAWVHACARPHFNDDGKSLGFVGTFEDITEQRQAREALENRARLDEFTTCLALQFMRLDESNLNDTIHRVLSNVGDFVAADRAYLFLHDLETRNISCVHEWCREGISAEIHNLQGIPLSTYGWFAKQLLCGEAVNVPSVADMPSEAVNERAELERESIQSLLLMPIVSSGRLVGFVGLDSVRHQRQWTADTSLLLRMVGESFLNAIHQQRSHEADRERARELEKFNLDLERRNTDLQRLAYAASHDLQEPLRTVSSFSSLLGKHYAGRLDERADEYIGYITDAAGRLHRLIHDLLAYTRVDQQVSEMVSCDLNEILRIVQDNLSPTMDSLGARIEIDELPTIHADPLQMIQLLQHLLANALRFHAEKPPHISVRAERTDSDWVISVADNGIGIPQEHVKRLFVIFQRLRRDDRHTGSGIGLAVCRRIVERHGGLIWVEPNQPRGSIFRWTIPAQVIATVEEKADGSRHAA